MGRIEILVEEPSMEECLKELLKKLYRKVGKMKKTILSESIRGKQTYKNLSVQKKGFLTIGMSLWQS